MKTCSKAERKKSSRFDRKGWALRSKGGKKGEKERRPATKSSEGKKELQLFAKCEQLALGRGREEAHRKGKLGVDGHRRERRNFVLRINKKKKSSPFREIEKPGWKKKKRGVSWGQALAKRKKKRQ